MRLEAVLSLGAIVAVSTASAAPPPSTPQEPSPAPAREGPVSPDALPPEVARIFGQDLPSSGLSTPSVIEGVEIIGNARTDRGVILSRLSLRPGDLVEEPAIEASRIRLLSTGFFRRVEFHLRRGSAMGLVLLVVNVEERNTLRVEDVAFGFGPGNVPFFALGVAETNFLGRGVTVGVAGAVGDARRAAELRLFVPTLSGSRLQLAGSALWVVGRERIDPSAGESGPNLDYERVGGTFGLGFESGPAQRISLVYRLESVTAERLPNLDPPILRRAPSILSDASVLSTLSATWERDTRDDSFAPSRGTRLALAVEVGTSVVGSDYEFSKYTAEVRHALHVFRGSSLVLHSFGGLVQGETPFFNQFFRRDFSRFSYGREALPRAVQLNFAEANDYDDLLLNVGVEYTWPLLEWRGEGLLRLLIYGAADFTISGSLEESQADLGGRDAFDVFPLTFDAGLKVDTSYGRFTLSLAYAADLAF